MSGARFTGSKTSRQEVGLPGHCERCAEVGHVRAHPNLGCADVGCYSAHDEDPAEAAGAAPAVAGRGPTVREVEAVALAEAQFHGRAWAGVQDRARAEVAVTALDAVRTAAGQPTPEAVGALRDAVAGLSVCQGGEEPYEVHQRYCVPLAEQVRAALDVLGSGDCDGSGWIVLNPHWPSGALPHRERCEGCPACRPEDYLQEVSSRRPVTTSGGPR